MEDPESTTIRTPVPGSEDQNPLVFRDLKRNMFAVVLFEFTWGMGVPFTLYGSMVPAYLTSMGSSKSFIGFMTSLWTIVTPVQLVVSHFFSSRRRVRHLMIFYILGVGLRLAYDLAVCLFPSLWTPASSLSLFGLGCTGFTLFITMGSPLYLGVMTDNVPRNTRGRLYGLRTLGLGLGGLLTGAVAAWVLHHWASPSNYRMSFLVGDSIFLLSCLSMLPFRDHRPSVPRESARLFFRSLRSKAGILLSNPNYRVFLFFHMLNACASAVTSFIVPYSKENLRVSDTEIAYLSLIFLGVNMAAGSLLGRLADRFGYRSVSVVQALSLMIFYFMALNARSLPAVCVAYGFSSIAGQSLLLVLCNMSVELCPGMAATDLTAIGNTFLLPFIAVVPSLAGFLIDLTKSYLSVFLIGFTLSLVALLGVLFLSREPRSGRLYAIREISTR